MPTKSLKLFVPDAPPFDQRKTWFETFVGMHILPLTERGLFRRFWFSRYGAIGHNKHILFRYEVDDVNAVAEGIAALQCIFPGGTDEDFDIVGDIGRGEGSRFLGLNARHQDDRKRGDIAFDFLHATARLFLHSLTGPDEYGRWHLERETQSGFNEETSLEQYHHLFCNMTEVPTLVAIAAHPEHGQKVMSLTSFYQVAGGDQRWVLQAKAPVRF